MLKEIITALSIALNSLVPPLGKPEPLIVNKKVIAEPKINKSCKELRYLKQLDDKVNFYSKYWNIEVNTMKSMLYALEETLGISNNAVIDRFLARTFSLKPYNLGVETTIAFLVKPKSTDKAIKEFWRKYHRYPNSIQDFINDIDNAEYVAKKIQEYFAWLRFFDSHNNCEYAFENVENITEKLLFAIDRIDEIKCNKKIVKRNSKKYENTINKYSEKFNIDPLLIYSLITVESCWNENAVSPAGAIGLMQLMPETARNLGVNPWNPYQNIVGGIKYLSNLNARNHNIENALKAYNAGQDRIDNDKVPKETIIFVERVTKLYNLLKH